MSTSTTDDQTQRLYVIYREPYTRGIGDEVPQMYLVETTWRQLLIDLLYTEPALSDEQYPDTDQLVRDFNQSNGDGADFVMVYCVEDKKVVLGEPA